MTTIMTTPSSPPKASFLGLTYELRLLIYDRVICLDVDFCIKRAFYRSVPLDRSLGDRWDEACELPINKLALVCRSVAEEIRSHALVLPSNQRVATMAFTDLPRGGFLYELYLRRLPCRFRQVSALNLEVSLDLPPAMRSTLLRRVVREKVDDLRGSLLHLLHTTQGVLKDTSELRDVFIHLTYTKPTFCMLSDEATNEMDREIRAQVEGQIVTFVNPQLAGRTLHLVC